MNIGLITLLTTLFFVITLQSQSIDDKQLGAWYMYFYNTTFNNSQWGIQGDIQYRDWRGLGDREQLLLRSGMTFSPANSGVKFTLGFANITTGQYGIDLDNPVSENRIYQEVLLSNTVLTRFLLTHRFRYEQRWLENQDFRSRYRYNLFINVPFNNTKLVTNTDDLALDNELFINGQRDIGNGREVSFFDRNRTYLGLGYTINDRLRIQFGWMEQTTANWQKGQLQFSLHHTF